MNMLFTLSFLNMMDIIWNKRFPYRVHSLHRWVLCSLTPVPEGVDRWRLYYVQRRQQEKRFGRIPKMKRHDVPVSDLYFLSQFFHLPMGLNIMVTHCFIFIQYMWMRC